MLKKITLLQLLFFCLFNAKAQEQSNVKLKIETGLDLLKPGLFLNVEPKVRFTENTFIGLRVGLMAYSGTTSVSTLNTRAVGDNPDFQWIIDEKAGNGIISFVPTFDYYLNERMFLERHFYRPFISLGMGYYILDSRIEATQISRADSSENEVKGTVNNRVVFLFRGGVQFDKLTIGLEYNFTPRVDIELSNDQTIGTVDLSFIGLSVGFTIDLRKPAS